ncbi:LuxR family transcriptional regulator [Serratia sp. IR-2025]
MAKLTPYFLRACSKGVKMHFCNKSINKLLKHQLDKAMETYGDIRFAYAVINKKDPFKIVIINNHPDWFDIYTQNAYQFIDPVIIKSLEQVEDFSWDDKILITSQLRLSRIFNDGKKHNIKRGHTFILHDNSNNLAVLSILEGDSGVGALNACIENHRETLQYLLVRIHQKMLFLYQDTTPAPLGAAATLTSRESEILFWSSSGKTYNEIAAIFAITQSTVKYHMRNIVRKLGVANAKHAIKLATELRIIKPGPVKFEHEALTNRN